MTTYILIDGSYYIFYRLYALVNWWKLSHKDEPIDNLHENEEFIMRFRNVFVTKLLEIPKKLGLPKYTNVKYIVGKDCKRENIWRMNLYPSYKATRGDYSDAKVHPAPFFKLAYEENLFQTVPNMNVSIVENPCLEADDCLAVTSKHLVKSYNDARVYIITSDTDYMQLLQPRIQLYNLKFKTVNTEKNSLGCPKKDLMCKILMGDKSDNIPAVFDKCGPKKAQSYINDLDKFQNDLIAFNKYEQYKLNRRLIDFNEIPEILQNEILEQCQQF